MAERPIQTLKWSEQMISVGDIYVDEANWGNAQYSGSVFVWENSRGLEIETRHGENILLAPTDKIVLGHSGAAYHAHITVAELLKGQDDDFISQIDLMEKINDASHFAKTRIEKTAYLVDVLKGEGLFGYALERWIEDRVRQVYREDPNFEAADLINVILREVLADPYDDRAKEIAAIVQNYLMDQGFFDLSEEIEETKREHPADGRGWVVFLQYASSIKENAAKEAEQLRSNLEMSQLLDPDLLTPSDH